LGRVVPAVPVTIDREKQRRRVRAAYFSELEKAVGPWDRKRLYELEVLKNGVPLTIFLGGLVD